MYVYTYIYISIYISFDTFCTPCSGGHPRRRCPNVWRRCADLGRVGERVFPVPQGVCGEA